MLIEPNYLVGIAIPLNGSQMLSKQNKMITCPECDSTNVDESLGHDGIHVAQTCKCRDCDTAWVVEYRPSVRRIVESEA